MNKSERPIFVKSVKLPNFTTRASIGPLVAVILLLSLHPMLNAFLATDGPLEVRELQDPDGLSIDLSGNLWVSNFGGTIDEINTSSLNVQRTIVLGFPHIWDLAFDPSDDLWVGGCRVTSCQIVEYNASSLATINATISRETSNLSTSGALDMAFDHHGDLWVTRPDSNDVVEFDTSSQVSSAPAITLTVTGINSPSAMTFDNSGNAWIVNQDSCGSTIPAGCVSEFLPGSLKSGNPAVRNVSLHASAKDIAFDPQGNMWVAGGQTGSIYEISAALLSSNSAAVVNTINDTGNPDALTFDKSSHLWVGNYDAGSVVEFDIDNTSSSVNSGPPYSIGISTLQFTAALALAIIVLFGVLAIRRRRRYSFAFPARQSLAWVFVEKIVVKKDMFVP